jgi:hypothetical protein
MKKPTQFLCKKCLAKMREYDTIRRQQWKLKIKVVNQQQSGKIKINKK